MQGCVLQVILVVVFLQLKVSACVFSVNYKQQQPVTMLIVKTEEQLARNSIRFAVVRQCWRNRLGSFRPPCEQGQLLPFPSLTSQALCCR